MTEIGSPRTFFFVRDYRQKYRFFSTEPERDLSVRLPRRKKIWEEAKKRLLLLPPRVLSQEKAFMAAAKQSGEPVPIVYASCHSERGVRFRFAFFLQKQRSKHVLLLIGESLLVPISGLAAFLPGPNVAFYVLALLMITQWQALRGINRLIHRPHEFLPSDVFSEWEEAVARGEGEERLAALLDRLESEYRLTDLKRILGK